MLCNQELKLVKHHTNYPKDMTIEICYRCHGAIHQLQREVRKRMKPRKKPIGVECNHCGHSWTYKGVNPMYCTCPSCLRKVKLF